MIRKTIFSLFMLIGIVLSASCSFAQISPTPQANTPDPVALPPTENAAGTCPAQLVVNAPLDYCFLYPQGSTLQINGNGVEIIGPHAGQGGLVAGVVWIDVVDAPGRTAQEIADEEVKAVGVNPPRSTVRLGGEEALVLEGMPGQDPIRKVYIVHNGVLYTLNFTPILSENGAANAQMETLYATVISSWVWISSGNPCPTIE